MAAYMWLILVRVYMYLVAVEIPDRALASEKNIITTPTTSKACYDVLGRDCFRYKDTDCVGPFETWARANCSLRCGYCPQKLPCADNLVYCNEFGKEVCHQEQYGQYMREHCRKFCNLCRAPTDYLVSSSPTTSTQEPSATTTAFNPVSGWCRDKLKDCWYYPDEKCVGFYEDWARENCPYRCGYCPNLLPPCQDLDINCNAYMNGSCTNTTYRAYMRENCRKHCNECHYPGEYLMPNTPPSTTVSTLKTPSRTFAISVNTMLPNGAVSQSTPMTTPTPGSTAHPVFITLTTSTLVSEWCQDKLKCWYYPDEKCVGGYESWARQNCPFRCGYCPNYYPPCVDLDSNCAAFRTGSCTNTTYRAYMREHCRKHCNECYYPGQYLKPNTPPTSVSLGPSPASTVETPDGPTTTKITVPTPGPESSIPDTLTTRKTSSSIPPLTTTTTLGLACPECDTNLTCLWNRTCLPGEVCMLLQYHNDPLTVHCSKKYDCTFMKTNVPDAVIKCCEDHRCIHNFIP